MLATNQIRLLAFAAAATWGLAARAEDPKLAQLLERSPSPANAIAYVHLPSLIKLMAAENMRAGNFEKIDEVWLVSELDIANLRPRWEAGYATLRSEVSADLIAKTFGGYVDTVSDKQVVWSPKQMYLVPMEDKRLGFLRPANRSVLSQWLDPGINVNYSGYLNQQAKQSETFLSLMVAVDLKDSFSPLPIEQRLADFTSLKAQPPKTVASILASVKGVSIIIGRRSLAECILAVEFEKSPASLVPIATELLAEILERGGAAAPEVLSWKVKVDGNTISFQGPILEDTLAGVLGIFSLSSQAEGVASSLSGKISLDKSASDQTAYRSKNYFDEIGTVVERVRKHKTQTTGSRALWNDQQARHIDEMGTLNVDPQVVDYGANVAELLRGNALTIRSGNIKAGEIKTAQGASRGFYGSYGYGGGYNSAYDVAASQRVTSAAARGAAYSDYTSVLSQIDQMTANLRRAMTDKYKIQF